MEQSAAATIGIIIIFSLFFLVNCKHKTIDEEQINEKIEEFEYHLEDLLLDVWYPRIIDTINGGYWSSFEYDWTLSESQTKFLVSQARGLWTAAKALEHYPKQELYQKAADHGFQYLITEMWDEQYGGFYSTSPKFAQKGEPQNKMAYGNAFAIYALAQYAKVSGSEEATEWAINTFHWLEKNAHDSIYGGYFNRLTQSGISANHGAYSKTLFQDSFWGNPEWKDQNSSIHLLEAFTTLYEVSSDSLVGKRLEEMLFLIRDVIIQEEGYLQLFLERDWTPISFREQGRAAVKENFNFDHVSFGHDIETAYLLLEASHILYGQEDEKTMTIAKKLVDHTLNNGFDTDYQGLFEGGYYFKKDTIEILKATKTWWAQIEALNTLLIFAKECPENTTYQTAFEQQWKYCKKYMIDSTYGGWYAQGIDVQAEYKTAKKASPWKTAYHTGRGLMNIVAQMRE